MAERLIASLADPIPVGDGQSIIVGASVGIAGFPHDGHDAEALLRAADQAMYTAKRGGKNRFVYAETPDASPTH